MAVSVNTYNFKINKGATFQLQLVWRDADTNPVNLTGYTARMQIRPTLASETILADLTTVNSKITLGGALGTIDLLLTATETAALEGTTAVYDLELQDASGFVTRLVEGSVELRPEVTR